MNEPPPIELKPMPLAAVIYVATFDEDGAITVEGKIHTDTAKRTRFEGDAAKTYLLMQHALETISQRLAASITEQAIAAHDEKRLLQTELPTTDT